MTANPAASRPAHEVGRITRREDVLAGQWRIAGTRMPTYIIWEMWQDGCDVEEIQHHVHASPTRIFPPRWHSSRAASLSASVPV